MFEYDRLTLDFAVLSLSPKPEPQVAVVSDNAPAALEDGFSMDEIESFGKLLYSPKKTPPPTYYCHICCRTGHYIVDCPIRSNGDFVALTKYQGRKKCYGEFHCQQCKRRWVSPNSFANEAQSCLRCRQSVFPHKQLPVEKAVKLGLINAEEVVSPKIAPIGHGRPKNKRRSV